MDLITLILGAQIGAALTTTTYGVATLLTGRTERRRDQADAFRAVKTVNADLFYLDFQAERLHHRQRSAQ